LREPSEFLLSEITVSSMSYHGFSTLSENS